MTLNLKKCAYCMVWAGFYFFGANKCPDLQDLQQHNNAISMG